MFLASLWDIIRVPFGWLLNVLYNFTTNYGLALIIFAILVKVILLPATAKSKRSSMKMSRLAPKMQEIQKKYANDPQKQNAAIQALYKEEGVSMGGGCLWSLIPLLVLIPLYEVIRHPIVYMLQESTEVAAVIVETVKAQLPELFGANSYYTEVIAAPHIAELAEEIKAAIAEAGLTIKDSTMAGINFTFLGVDLGQDPVFNIFGSQWSWDWNHIGGFLIPIFSAGSQVLSMFISQKMNNSVVTNENGMQDKETAAKSQAAQTNKIMMYTMPLMSLWIGFTVPAALSLYWFIQGIVSVGLDVYLTKKYRTIYDAEDAEKLKRYLEEQALEDEKERIRAEKRAANPDGITANTSKKKLQKQQQQAEEAAKAAAKKEYDAKKGIVEEEKTQKEVMSGIPDRPYCKGRAYDPSRYSQNTEE